MRIDEEELMDEIKLYIIHQWSMEKLRSLIVTELNDSGVCKFVDLSGSKNTPIDADRDILDGYIYGGLKDADIIVVLVPDPFFQEKNINAEREKVIGDIFLMELGYVQFDVTLINKPIVPMAFSYRVAEEFVQHIGTGFEVEKLNPTANPDRVIPMPIDVNDKKSMAFRLKGLMRFKF